jgi:hypothetical protein
MESEGQASDSYFLAKIPEVCVENRERRCRLQANRYGFERGATPCPSFSVLFGVL